MLTKRLLLWRPWLHIPPVWRVLHWHGKGPPRLSPGDYRIGAQLQLAGVQKRNYWWVRFSPGWSSWGLWSQVQKCNKQMQGFGSSEYHGTTITGISVWYSRIAHARGSGLAKCRANPADGLSSSWWDGSKARGETDWNRELWWIWRARENYSTRNNLWRGQL